MAYDICYPANDQEYEALGKNAVLMLTSSSVLGSELPIKAAYIKSKGVRVPLQRLALIDKHERPSDSDPSKVYIEQVSFYLLPIYLMKQDAALLVDFSGPRTGFEVATFEARKGLGRNAPAFARLDEYDSASDPEMAAVAALLEREYPDYFHASEAK